MKHYMRVCAEINLDAVAYNFKSMKDNLTPGTKMVAVVKTDGYGHGAVPIAQMVEAYDYIWYMQWQPLRRHCCFARQASKNRS